jgi:hypothetical protein
MSIQKLKEHQKQIPYTMVSREVVQSIQSPDALAIWTYLQSQSDNWQVVESHICEHFSMSRQRYLRAMKVLREAGLYEVVRIKNSNNEFTGSYFHIYPFPQVRESTLMETDTYIKENEIIKEKESIKENKGASRVGIEKPVNVSEEVWKDFKKQRKSKLTQTALNGIIKQAELAGWSLQQALTEVVERGWQSFKAEWVNKQNRNQSSDMTLTELIEGWYE